MSSSWFRWAAKAASTTPLGLDKSGVGEGVAVGLVGEGVKVGRGVGVRLGTGVSDGGCVAEGVRVIVGVQVAGRPMVAAGPRGVALAGAGAGRMAPQAESNPPTVRAVRSPQLPGSSPNFPEVGRKYGGLKSRPPRFGRRDKSGER